MTAVGGGSSATKVVSTSGSGAGSLEGAPSGGAGTAAGAEPSVVDAVEGSGSTTGRARATGTAGWVPVMSPT